MATADELAGAQARVLAKVGAVAALVAKRTTDLDPPPSRIWTPDDDLPANRNILRGAQEAGPRWKCGVRRELLAHGPGRPAVANSERRDVRARSGRAPALG